jgi:hypothetical protein
MRATKGRLKKQANPGARAQYLITLGMPLNSGVEGERTKE